MKLENADVELHTRGMGNKHKYSVAQNAKIMKMLADGLYSDKVLAPVRELSTNARDGHIKGGNEDVPFDVYLPTRTNLEFRIRDYGCGMNYDQLTKMYTTYGDSDKNESNDMNGCMGIGSKSPFAYSDSFTTTSFHNGLKYVCVNAKDEDGIPTLQFMAEGIATDEPNGIEIAFAVKAEDVMKFEEAAKKVYRYFPVRPNIKRGDIRIAPREYMYEGSNWRIYKDSNESMAVMGWIAYPIDKKHFSKLREDKYAYHSYDDSPEVQLLNLGIEMDFEIGDIEMDIAREALQYTKKSINIIKARLGEILEFLKQEMNKSFNDCASLWEARLRYQDLTKGKMRQLEKLAKIQTPTFNNIKLDESIDFSPLKGVHIVKFRGDGYKKPKREDRVSDFYVPTTAGMKDIAFFDNDVERGAYSGCERIINDKDNDVNTIYLVRFDDAAAKKSFLDTMGWIDDSLLLKASTLPKADKTGAKGPRDNVFEFDLTKASTSRSSARWAKDWWKAVEVEFDDGGLFVELNSFKCRDAKGTEIQSVDIGRMIKLLETLGVQVPEQLVGVKTAVCKRYRKSEDWEDVFDWIKRQFDDYLKLKNVGEVLANIQEIERFNKEKYDNLFKTKSIVDLTTSPINDFYKKLTELDAVRKKESAACENAKVLADMLKYSLAGQAKYDLNAEEQKISSRYEMLEILDSWDVCRGNNAEKVARYIQFVDNCEGV